METRDKIQIGQIVPVKEYNQLAENKWVQRSDEARIKNQPRPNLCFFVFTDRRGNYRTRGFVKRTAHDSWLFAKTKKELLLK